jgi:hypothetical protein
VQFGLDHPDHYRATFVIPHCNDSAHAHHKFSPEEMENSLGMQCFNSLRMGVAECIRLGYFRPVDVETTSQAIWANLHGITSLLIGNSDFPWVEKQQLIRFTVDTMIDGLLAGPLVANAGA